MNNGGQICISVERVYVEEPVYDEFVAKVDRARCARCARARPTGPARVDVGAVTFAPQMDIDRRATCKDAVEKGARSLAGGHAAAGRRPLLRADRAGRRRPHDDVHDRGDVRPDAADHEGARRGRGGAARQRLALRARRRRSGRRTSRKGEAVARRVEAGAVCVNDAQVNYAALELPMGGWKESGLGSRHGAGGIRKYCAAADAARHALRRQDATCTCSPTARARRSCWGASRSSCTAGESGTSDPTVRLVVAGRPQDRTLRTARPPSGSCRAGAPARAPSSPRSCGAPSPSRALRPAAG